MLPPRWEYFTLLMVLALFIGGAFWTKITLLYRRPEFLAALSIYTFLGVLLDVIAIKWGWWSFSTSRLCGIGLLGVPIEEVILFVMLFTGTISFWELLLHELD